MSETLTDEQMAERVEALRAAVDERFGGMRADFNVGGSMSVNEALAEFALRLRRSGKDDSGARARLAKLTHGQFFRAAQAGNLAIDAVLADIREVLAALPTPSPQ